MKKLLHKKTYCISILLLFSYTLNGSIIISGQPKTLGNPFPFLIQATAYDMRDTAFFVGAHEPITVDADKSQAISVVVGEEIAVTGVTPEKIQLNNVNDQDNPLYGKQIDFLEVVGNTDLFTVTHDQNTRVSMLRNVRSIGRALYQSAPLQAGNGVTDGIVGLATGFGNEVPFKSGNVETSTYAHQRFFAAVRPNAGLFGQVGGGIVEGVLNVTDIGSKEKGKETVILQYSLDQLAFVALNTTTPAVKIGADLASIDNEALNKNVVMINGFAFTSFTYFTGLFVTGGAAVGDGARGVTLAGAGTIAPDAAIEDDSIIGGRTTVINNNVQVSIHFLSTLATSTRLDYLVVVGGVGSPSATARAVYALPLNQNGVLAKKTAIPQSKYSTTKWQWLQARYFDDPAQNAGDLFSPSDPDIYKARVGGTATLPGDITALFTEKDAVFVTVGTGSATEKAGVFYSQALFDAAGAIQGWTDWQRAVGTTDQIFGLAYDNKRGTFWFLPGSDANSLTTLKKTVWQNNGFTGFDQTLQDSFTGLPTGSQGLFDIPKTNDAFSQTVGNRIAVLVATGYQKVVLLQNGADEGTLFTPTETFTTTVTATDGTLNNLVTPAQKIEMTGGVLQELGPIIAADIVSDGISSWLVVGGSGGAAVLANPDGSGWPVGTLEKGFVNLPSTLAWKKLSDVTQVRKMVADGTNLYILTSSELKRIGVSAAVFASSETEQGVTLATAASLLSSLVDGNGSFSDATISGKFALLATSAGLYRVGNDCSIAQALNENLVNWRAIVLPESAGPVTRLYVISPTGREIDFAQDERGGNIYILDGNVALAQARVYRATVQGLIDDAPISDTTFQLFEDMFVKDHISMYVNRGDYRNYLATDGAALMMTRSRYAPKIQTNNFQSIPSFLEVINPVVKVGERRAAMGSLAFFVRPITAAEQSYHIGPVIKRSTTGSWMAAGTFLMVGQ